MGYFLRQGNQMTNDKTKRRKKSRNKQTGFHVAHRGFHGVRVWVEQLVRHRPLEDPHEALGVAGNLAVGEESVLQEGRVHSTPRVELVLAAHLQPAVDALVEKPPRQDIRAFSLLAIFRSGGVDGEAEGRGEGQRRLVHMYAVVYTCYTMTRKCVPTGVHQHRGGARKHRRK